MPTRIRMGLLGAAAVAPAALLAPARRDPRVTVTAVAARDRARADAFARKHGIPRVHHGYEDLLADPDVDAVYVPLPNGLHADWTLKALAAGKHVLCEKPFTANAAEAERVADAARAAHERSGLVTMEAFHYRHHPLAARMREIVDGGELGTLRRVEAEVCFPLPRFGDIRYSYELAGGATMDAGCYAVHVLRLLGPGEPEVTSARALTLRGEPRIDRAMTAQLAFDDGTTGGVRASMWSRRLLSIRARATGDDGALDVTNFLMPHVYHQLTVRRPGGRGGRVVRRERLARRPSSYDHQLSAFAAAVLDGAPVLTSPEDAVANLRVLDAIYRASGLPVRGTP
ncbi:Gfo/Idh/MocA family oxidoreductase [Streptomyces sp. NPDC001941]|uniref:Gfo/Idh/MocA family protein n=1 Tax=Streptomyces sp. NPDC001941 TaxID=3154659 RepID=UPI00331D3EC2